MDAKEINSITEWLAAMSYDDRIEMIKTQRCMTMNPKLHELNCWLSQLEIAERLLILVTLTDIIEIGNLNLKYAEEHNNNYEYMALTLSILKGLKNSYGFPDEINIEKEWHEEQKTLK